LSARALYEGTSLLPLVGPAVPERAAGLDTVEAIQSGVYHCCRGGVRELVRLLAEGCGTPPPVVVTGGDAGILLPLDVGCEVKEAPELIFVGMAAALGL
jgi:pantothenate kinase type III